MADKLIQQANLLHVNAPKTFTSFNENAGVGTIRWENPNGFAASHAIQIGEIGEEQTEVVLLGTATPAGTAGTLVAATLYEHPANTPIYDINFNQVIFTRNTAGTTSAGTILAGGTITYQADSDYTRFNDTDWLQSYNYQTYYKNSVTGGTTGLSSWITFPNPLYSKGYIRSRIRNKMWNSTFIQDDSIIDDWINEWKDKMTNVLVSVNEDYSLGTADIAFGTTGLGTVTIADFKQPKRVWVTYNGNDYFQSTKMEVNEYIPNQIFSASHPRHAWFGDTIFQIKPEQSGGTARLAFYRLGTPMVNDDDTLPLPLRAYTDSFVEYGLLQAQYKDEKISLADKKTAENVLMGEFKSQIAPRDRSGPTYIDVIESISGEDADFY